MWRHITLIPIWALVASPAWAACQQSPFVSQFFDILTGDWQGEAVVTPVGPLPYDISFKQQEPLRLYGQANPGAAIHHWEFYCQDTQLALRFLSTFRGNNDPLLLESLSVRPNKIHFKAQEPDFLEVEVRFGSEHSTFEVLHYGKRHVLIELKR